MKSCWHVNGLCFGGRNPGFMWDAFLGCILFQMQKGKGRRPVQGWSIILYYSWKLVYNEQKSLYL